MNPPLIERNQNDSRCNCAGNVDSELDHFNPDHRFHATKIGEDDHCQADQDDRADDYRFRVCRRLKSSVDRRQHDRRQK